MRANPLFILAVLSFLVLASEWLVRRSVLRHMGSALLVILLAAIVANLGIIPAGSTPAAPVRLYDAIFAYVAPIAIFWLLLGVNLRRVLQAGLPMIALFLMGSLGTVIGVVVGMAMVTGESSIGPMYAPLAGMFAGTYIGGSVNFNAIALQYGMVKEGAIYGGAVVVDNIITTIWMAATLTFPRLLAPLWLARRRRARAGSAGENEPATPRAAGIVDLAAETESVDPRTIAAVIALGVGALWASETLSRVLSTEGLPVPTILIITTLALILAQVPAIHVLRGVRAIGMYAVYLFLAVIGAFCDVRAMAGLGRLGLILLAFAAITVSLHGLIVFGTAWIFRMDLDGAAVASQANVGGSTSALALAKSLGREDLLLPAILLGAIGNAIGTFIGFWVTGLV